MAIAIKGNDGVLHLHPTGTQTAISGDKTLVLTDTEIVKVYATSDVSQSLKYTTVDDADTITTD